MWLGGGGGGGASCGRVTPEAGPPRRRRRRWRAPRLSAWRRGGGGGARVGRHRRAPRGRVRAAAPVRAGSGGGRPRGRRPCAAVLQQTGRTRRDGLCEPPGVITTSVRLSRAALQAANAKVGCASDRCLGGFSAHRAAAVHTEQPLCTQNSRCAHRTAVIHSEQPLCSFVFSIQRRQGPAVACPHLVCPWCASAWLRKWTGRLALQPVWPCASLTWCAPGVPWCALVSLVCDWCAPGVPLGAAGSGHGDHAAPERVHVCAQGQAPPLPGHQVPCRG